MRTPGHDFELAAGLAGARGHRPARRPRRGRLLHRRGPRARAGVQRRHGDARGPAGRRPRAPPRRAVLGLLGVRGVRQGQHRGGARRGRRAARWSRRAAGARRRTTPAGGDCASGRPSSTGPAACTRPGCSTPTARCSPSARTSGGTTPSTRSPAPGCWPGTPPPPACLVRQRAGRLRAGPEGRRARGRRRWSRSARRPASPPGWPRESGLVLYGFTSARRCVRYT